MMKLYPPKAALAAILAAVIATAGTGYAQGTVPLADIVTDWLNSPHAKQQSESFRHWDEDGAIPQDCAACHSSPGLVDFLGADGSSGGVVDHPAMTGSLVDCVACHNQMASTLDSVTFPSGEVVADLGTSAICMVCHQGRLSGDAVAAAAEGREDDVIAADLGFLNVHYRAAAASLLGSVVRGGYQYDGKSYADRFSHVPDFATCTTCHSPHTLEVATADCAACHKTDDLRAIRTSPADADGDGDTVEGVAGEIATLHDTLGRAIMIYAEEIAGTPLVYAPDAYPYFFTDSNRDGLADADEAVYPNRYQSWTPRLLKAAYNYQFVAKDPGAYSHNPRYAQQLMIDSLEDLSTKVSLDLSRVVRP
jgi:hypothetical protein